MRSVLAMGLMLSVLSGCEMLGLSDGDGGGGGAILRPKRAKNRRRLLPERGHG